MLSGTNLCDAEVMIDGLPVPVLFSDATMIEFEMPPGSGSVQVELITSSGVVFVPITLEYGLPEVGDVLPSTGLNCVGGDMVVLMGMHLCDAEVIIDGLPVPVLFSDATMIEFEMPPGSGSVQVEVITPSGPVLVFLEYGSCCDDLDSDGICDDIDDCVGILDACGVCNGPGAVYGCGCYDVPTGDCDCNGNQLDANGICGGDCIATTNCPDLDLDGIIGVGDILIILGEFGSVCEGPIFGCTLPEYMEYNPEATVNDGSCATLVIEGCTDPAYLEYDSTANTDDGSCATAVVNGCTDPAYLEYDSTANTDDGSCAIAVVNGCTDPAYVEYDATANTDDGSCATLTCANAARRWTATATAWWRSATNAGLRRTCARRFMLMARRYRKSLATAHGQG